MTFAFASAWAAFPTNGPVRAIALSPDGAALAVATQPPAGPAVSVLRTHDGTVTASYGEGTRVVRGLEAGGTVAQCASLAFVDGGGALWFSLDVVGGGRSVWEVGADGVARRIETGTSVQYQSLRAHPTLPLVALAGRDVEVRDARSRETVAFLPGAGATAVDAVVVAFAAQGPRLWAWGTDGAALALHDLASGTVVRHAAAPTPFGRHVDASMDGRWLLAGGTRGTRLFDLARGASYDKLPWYDVTFSKLAPGARAVFSPSSAALVYVASAATAVDLTGETPRRIDGPSAGGTARVVAAAAACDASVYAFATDEGRVLCIRGVAGDGGLVR